MYLACQVFLFPVPSLFRGICGAFSFWIYMQKTSICLYTDRIICKYIHACPSAWFSSLFPTKRNVSEPMDNENSINILLSPFFNKGREREGLFNIRPSFGCTLSITKYLWLQIRCKRGLERKVRELPASADLRRLSESRGLPRTSYSRPLPPSPHLPPPPRPAHSLLYA